MTDSLPGKPVNEARLQPVRLSRLQYAWLTEIGLERNMLVRYVSQRTPSVHAADVDSATAPAQHGSGERRGSAAEEAHIQTAQRGSSSEHVAAALEQVRAQLKPETARVVSNGPEPVGSHVVQAVAALRHDLPTDWAALQAHAQACQACGLQAERDQLVFGAGDTESPEWLIVGEAPGKVDDGAGLPFQGKAGQLLHAMLVAVGVHPRTVVLGANVQLIQSWSRPTSMYFTNLVKCRPLGNRSPEASEIKSCFPYLQQQVDMLRPRRIMALGRLAAQALLQVDADVEELRGKVHHLTTTSGRKIPVVVTWHPAVLMMHPQHKGAAWADLNLAKGCD